MDKRKKDKYQINFSQTTGSRLESIPELSPNIDGGRFRQGSVTSVKSNKIEKA